MSDPTTAIAAAPLVAIIKPYLEVAVDAAITGLIGWGVLLVQKWTGVQIQASLVNSIKSAAATEAGRLVASAEDNLATKSINVGSPIVAQAVTNIQGRIPDVLKSAGATPETLGAIVAGEIGKLQASTVATPVIPPAAPAVAIPRG